VISLFVQLDTWFLYLIWVGISVLSVVIFFNVTVQFSVLTLFFCVVLVTYVHLTVYIVF
jgi:hypothetical protein